MTSRFNKENAPLLYQREENEKVKYVSFYDVFPITIRQFFRLIIPLVRSKKYSQNCPIDAI
jgi:hypothetical protein